MTRFIKLYRYARASGLAKKRSSFSLAVRWWWQGQDFVQLPTRSRTTVPNPRPTMIPRNKPCPCNSGKKYKNCCWQQILHPPKRQPCGHLESEIVSHGETHHCGKCNEIAHATPPVPERGKVSPEARSIPERRRMSPLMSVALLAGVMMGGMGGGSRRL